MADLLLQLLIAAILLALATTGMVALVRVLPFVQGWTARGVRPFACDACMAFWTLGAIALVTSRESVNEVLVAAVPAYGLALLFLSHLGRMPSSPPSFGRPGDDEEVLQ